MLGARKGSTPLSYNLQPQAQYVYDPIARRAVRYVETIVPTLALLDSVRSKAIPADRYYANLGAIDGVSSQPFWADGGSPSTFQLFDTSEKRQYMQLNGGYFASGTLPLIHYAGPFGAATNHAPKNAEAVAVWIKARGRFPTNADYTVHGIGATTGTAGATFNTVTYHFFQVLRNSGSWELGTADGAALSQSSGGSADGNWHDFWVKWTASEVLLYVDGVLTITKTTNLPTQPLKVNAISSGNALDIVDYLVEWEIG